MITVYLIEKLAAAFHTKKNSGSNLGGGGESWPSSAHTVFTLFASHFNSFLPFFFMIQILTEEIT